MKKQIVAMGGGGFARGNLAMDKFFLDLTGTKNPKVCFIPTASGDSAGYIARFFEAYSHLGAKVETLQFFRPVTVDIEDYLSGFDAIYVGGGNTRSQIAIWKYWGVDKALKKAYEKGVVCGGLSAGCNAWFQESHSDSIMPNWCVAPGLGILEGSVCPHFTGESRRDSYEAMVRGKKIQPGYAFDDGAAGYFVDGKLETVISESEKSKGYKVDLATEKLKSQTLEPVIKYF